MPSIYIWFAFISKKEKYAAADDAREIDHRSIRSNSCLSETIMFIIILTN
jgi:hypothetical protein